VTGPWLDSAVAGASAVVVADWAAAWSPDPVCVACCSVAAVLREPAQELLACVWSPLRLSPRRLI
jgi:hypothetical protein